MINTIQEQRNENMRPHQKIFFAYLSALFFTGLIYLAILPPFEGFDETAHYSSIRQIADTGTIPVYGKSFLDQEAKDYQGPFAYSSGNPPFDQGVTYAKFFANPSLVDNYLLAYHRPHESSYHPSQEQNWQAQHPPLYYILLAPLEKVTESLSFMMRIFLLRLASFFIALVGVVLGLAAVKQTGASFKANSVITGFIMYPIVLPMFFPEFTRIGNDSLCLCLAGTIAFLLSKWFKDESNKKLMLTIGVVLGLGLLTKAFFLPIIAALGIFLFVRVIFDIDGVVTSSARWKQFALIFLPAIIIGGGWYAYKLIVFGSLTGSGDDIILANHGGLVANLKEKFSLYAVVRGLVVTFVSYSWAGTWSLTRLPVLMHVPLLVLALWCFGTFVAQLKQHPLTDPVWLPVWLLGMFSAGFLYHAIIGVALSGNGQTPGWYLHILMPWFAPALGMGICALFENPRTKPFLIGLLFYAALFQIIALWAQLALFTGCATKGDDKSYVFSGHTLCLDQTSMLMSRLSVLGWPALAAVGFSGVLTCAILLITLRCRPAAVD